MVTKRKNPLLEWLILALLGVADAVLVYGYGIYISTPLEKRGDLGWLALFALGVFVLIRFAIQESQR